MLQPVLVSHVERSRWSHIAMFSIVLLLGVFSVFYGEKVPAGGGFGWDGVIYAKVVREFPQMLSQGELNTYYAQRVLPAVIIRAGLVVTGFDFRPAYIIRAFEVYNLAILLIGCFFWKKISDTSNFPVSIRWLGFGSIFLNFSVSKQNFFYPVLTDATALTVGLGLLYCYLARKRLVLALLCVAGAFAWPTAAPTGALLLFLGYCCPTAPAAGVNEAPRAGLSTLRAYLLVCLGLVLLLLAMRSEHATIVDACVIGTRIGLALLPGAIGTFNLNDPCSSFRRVVTAIPSILGLALLLRHLLGPLFSRSNIRRIRGDLRLGHVVLALSVLAAVLVGVRLIANTALPNPSGIGLLLRLAWMPDMEGQILMPLVSLISFYGPAVILIICLWRQVCAEALGNGAGFAMAVVAGMIFSVVGEPRFMTLIWPFLVFCLAQALKRQPPSRAVLAVFSVLVIVMGQFWLPINLVSWSGDDYAGLLSFPKQLYFMHYGLWMGWPAYVFQAIVFACAFWWFKRALTQRRNDVDI